MGYTAIHRFARISPRKVRSLADLVREIRGRRVDILRYMPHRGARMLEKVIRTRWPTPKIGRPASSAN